MRRVVDLLTSNRDLVEARLRALRGVSVLQHSLRLSTPEGYGRLDAFGIGRDELFGGTAGNSVPADAPVSFPHIWGMEYTGWLQWGANTDSVMERNIGQALGVGALFDPRTYETTVNIPNLHRLEQLGYRLTPPVWPATFPAIDAARADHGKALFVQHCAPCHETYKTDGVMRTYQLFSFEQTGTDPLAAIDYELPVVQPDGTLQPFPYAAGDLISKIKEKAYGTPATTPPRSCGWRIARCDADRSGTRRFVRRSWTPRGMPIRRAAECTGRRRSWASGRAARSCTTDPFRRFTTCCFRRPCARRRSRWARVNTIR